MAVSESDILASPHSVIPNRDSEEVMSRIAEIADEFSVGTIVLGIPRRGRADARLEQTFENIAERIRQRTCRTVVLWNEELTTVEASRSMRQSGKKPNEMKNEIDMHAAAVILQSYLDEMMRRSP